MQAFMLLLSLVAPAGLGQGCVPEWSCTEWSPCEDGRTARTCRDLNNCGTTRGMPPERQSCPIGIPRSQFFRRGDSDADRELRLTDAVFTLNFLFLGGQEPQCLDAADANDDGRVNLTDPIITLNYLFRGGNPLATEVGSDPTPDTLGCQDYPYCSSQPLVPFPTACVAFDESTPQSRTLSRGEQNVVFLKVKITAAEREVTPMNGIQIGTRAANVNRMLTNFRAVKEGVVLGSIGSSLAFNGDYFYHWTMLQPTLVIQAFNSVVIEIVADVRDDASDGSVNLGIFGFNFEPPGAFFLSEYYSYEGNIMTIE